MRELSPRLLNLPEAMAGRYARRDSWLYDELVSRGMMALDRAVRDYDPKAAPTSPGATGHASLETYCYRRVWASALRGIRQSRKHLGLRSLDEPLRATAERRLRTLGSILPGPAPDPAQEVSRRDFVERLLCRLDPRSRWLVWEHYAMGRTYEEVAARTDPRISRERVRVLLRAAADRLREAAKREGLTW